MSHLDLTLLLSGFQFLQHSLRKKTRIILSAQDPTLLFVLPSDTNSHINPATLLKWETGMDTTPFNPHRLFIQMSPAVVGTGCPTKMPSSLPLGSLSAWGYMAESPGVTKIMKLFTNWSWNGSWPPISWALSNGICLGDITKAPLVGEGEEGVCPALMMEEEGVSEELEPQQGAGEGRRVDVPGTARGNQQGYWWTVGDQLVFLETTEFLGIG